ncbi:MAG: zinc ribbon domain-containing protein [Candidatus Bathyarchaeia archaeon]
MKARLVNQILLILIIASASTSLLANTLPENGYTTTITERRTTTLTTTRTETVEVTVTTSLTRTSTVEIPVSTRGVILVQRTTLIPTTYRTSFIYTTTSYRMICYTNPGGTTCSLRVVTVTMGTRVLRIPLTTCRTFYGDVECEEHREVYTMAGQQIVRTYVPAIVQVPLTVTSETTLLSATTETLETTTLGRSTRTVEEPILLTLENVYTSYVTYPATPTPTPEQQGGYDYGLPKLMADNLPWIIIALIVLVAALIVGVRRRPRFKPGVAMTYCMNCGAQIPGNVKYCPNCGALQK